MKLYEKLIDDISESGSNWIEIMVLRDYWTGEFIKSFTSVTSLEEIEKCALASNCKHYFLTLENFSCDNKILGGSFS